MTPTAIPAAERTTSVGRIFDHLYEEIVSLRLRPGDKLSEADVAAAFGVSRQPARDAFGRLANLGLVTVRPQRATEVRRFSRREIDKSRFVRAAVEMEALRRGSARCDRVGAATLERELDRQAEALHGGDFGRFAALDYEFHAALCSIAGVGYAAEVIAAEKAKVDRLCMLGLAKEDRMPLLLEDHRAIARAVIEGDAEAAAQAGATHLSRLDETIAAIRRNNADYFEPEN